MAAQMTGRYLGNLGVEYTHLQSGAVIVSDAPTDNGGRGQAFSPTDLCASALAGCAMTIMAKQADVLGIDLKGTSFEVLKVMAANPRRIARIEIVFKFPEGEYSDKVKTQLVRAAGTCPVHFSLAEGLEQVISLSFPDGSVLPVH